MANQSLINAKEQDKIPRHIERCKRIKAHLEKPGLSKEKKESLKRELESRMDVLKEPER